VRPATQKARASGVDQTVAKRFAHMTQPVSRALNKELTVKQSLHVRGHSAARHDRCLLCWKSHQAPRWFHPHSDTPRLVPDSTKCNSKRSRQHERPSKASPLGCKGATKLGGCLRHQPLTYVATRQTISFCDGTTCRCEHGASYVRWKKVSYITAR
jgi:hypothetical protein